MSTYHLSIFTPYGKVFDGQVDALMAPGEMGSFGVLARHAPMVSALTNGVLKLRHDSQEKFFALNSGVLEVDGQHNVLVLSDNALAANNIEEAKEKTKSFNKN